MTYLAVGLVALLVWLYKGRSEKLSMFPPAVANWYSIAERYAILYNVPVEIIMAMIKHESSGDRFAEGLSTEKGLMQVKQIAIDDLIDNGYSVNPTQTFDAMENIEQGVSYLDLQRKRVGNDWESILWAYNQGEGGYNQRKMEGKDYAERILNTATKYGYSGYYGTF